MHELVKYIKDNYTEYITEDQLYEDYRKIHNIWVYFPNGYGVSVVIFGKPYDYRETELFYIYNGNFLHEDVEINITVDELETILQRVKNL